MALNLATWGSQILGAEGVAAGLAGRSTGLGQKPFLNTGGRSSSGPNVATLPRREGGPRYNNLQVSAVAVEADYRSVPSTSGRGQRGTFYVPDTFQVDAYHGPSSSLPPALYRLLDPSASVDLPPSHKINPRCLDNRELDKLVGALGRNKATWRRTLLLHEWLLSLGHLPDDRLCTTLIRVCSQHGQAQTALGLYEWMRARLEEGGAGLVPTVFTYTAAMRAALSSNLLDRAFKVWEDAISDGCEPDCRMATTLIEVCARSGDTQRALATYEQMRTAPKNTKMEPSVHAYTAAMRAAAEGGSWQRALDIWSDMEKAGCRPTGHSYAAVISACASGGEWQRAIHLFDEMVEWQIKPDVVSCTALITALGTDGQWERAEKVVQWMVQASIKPNVRTYTALVTALGNARQWERAVELIAQMRKQQAWGGVEPNAYTYSALLKTMGEQGQWQMAERVFSELEEEALRQAEQGEALYSTAGPSQQHHQAAWPATPSAAVVEAGISQQLSSMGIGGYNPLEPYGLLPTVLAEQVLQPPHSLADQLPDGLPGQSNSSSSFSYFSGAAPVLPPPVVPPAAESGPRRKSNSWTVSNAAVRGLELQGGADVVQHVQPGPVYAAANSWSPDRLEEQRLKYSRGPSKVRGPLNEVVCGALMLAYERGGRHQKAVAMLERAAKLGLQPNTIMYNTAMSALGKAGQWQAAEALFQEIPAPDAVSYETLIAAYGTSGQADKAEKVFDAMRKAGHMPRDYAFCGVVAGHSLSGDWRRALAVRQRMLSSHVAPTVHVYNALIAACERAGQWDKGLELSRQMARDGIAPDSGTQQLLVALGRKGVEAVEAQQLSAAALSAAVAAAGTLMMRCGIF